MQFRLWRAAAFVSSPMHLFIEVLQFLSLRRATLTRYRRVNKTCIGDDTKAAARQGLNCIKNKKNKIWRKTIFNTADGIHTPCNVARSGHWFRQVTAPCNVPYVVLESWQWIHQVAAPCNVLRGSGMTCHWIRPNVRHIGILHLVSILTTSPQSTCHSAPVSEILSKLDHPRQKK